MASLSDKSALMQVIGGLMKSPIILVDDKYIFTTKDFDEPIANMAFQVINNLFSQYKPDTITIVDIDNYLQQYADTYQVFTKNNGVQYLKDCLDVVNVSNFKYYYDKMKKLSALRILKRDGFNIKEILDENEINLAKEKKQLEKLDSMSVEDIFDFFIKELNDLTCDYIIKNDTEEGEISSGIDDVLASLEETPEIGYPLQGAIYNTIARGARLKKFYINSSASGMGKALPNNTLIPTPNGWKTVGEVKVGDYLFDAFGKPTKVLAVYPQKEQKEIWEVHFKDGRIAECCEEHLWSYCTASQGKNSKDNRKFYTNTIKEISKKQLQTKNGQYNILVPMQKAVEYEEKDLSIDPYLLGLFIGDGSFKFNDTNKALVFSTSEEELLNNICGILGPQWMYKKCSNYNYSYTFKNLKDETHNLWVEEFLKDYPELIQCDSNNKFIPNIYLQGSIQQRLSLLQGLMDTDGSIDKKCGRLIFTTVSEKLKDNFIELCESLGYIVTYSISYDDKKYKQGRCFNIRIQCNKEDKKNIFRLSRKKEIAIQNADKDIRTESKQWNPIVSIVNTHKLSDMTCFYVDNDEHLFLMNDYIVTHNTRGMVGDACNIAYPERYNLDKREWEIVGEGRKILYFTTEMEKDEIQTLIVAFLSGVNEDKILRNTYDNPLEKERVKHAVEIMKEYKDNFIFIRVADPSVAQVKAMIRKEVLKHDIYYVFYDYIFSSPALSNEYKGLGLRDDLLLLYLSTALKDLANELGVFMMSATQLADKWKDWKGIRDYGLIRGSRSIADKCDLGKISMLVMDEERKMVDMIAKKLKVQLPNYVQDIYKVRRGKYNKVRIWSFFDFGTCRLTDLFLTDENYNLIDITCDEYIGDDKSASKELIQQLLLEKEIEGVEPITNYHGEDAHEIDEEIEEIFEIKEPDWSDLI